MATIFEFLNNMLQFITNWSNKRNEDDKVLWTSIESTRKLLIEALAEGRVTDVAILRKELEKLMARYARDIKIEERNLKRSNSTKNNIVNYAIIGFLLLTALGCTSNNTVFVSGHRIHLVEPGQTVVVPQLDTPAQQWYLIDNVAILHWLGIPLNSNETLKTK